MGRKGGGEEGEVILGKQSREPTEFYAPELIAWAKLIHSGRTNVRPCSVVISGEPIKKMSWQQGLDLRNRL